MLRRRARARCAALMGRAAATWVLALVCYFCCTLGASQMRYSYLRGNSFRKTWERGLQSRRSLWSQISPGLRRQVFFGWKSVRLAGSG